MFQILLTKSAERDLQNAAFYIANDLGNKPAANRFLDAAEKALASLADFPG